MGGTSTLYATQTPTPAVIPIADGSGRLNDWVDALINPMTSEWDLVVGGVAGEPERLAVGIPGEVLTVGSGGEVVWEAPAPSLVIQGTTGEIDVVTDGSGVVTISLPDAIVLTGKSITGGAFFAEELNGPVGVTSQDTGAFTSVQAQSIDLSGTLNFASLTQRIIGDLSNATASDRVMFQSSTVNGNTAVGTIPNGAGTISGFVSYNSSDADNASKGQFYVTGAGFVLNSGKTGTGTTLPLSLAIDDTAKLTISTAGDVTVAQALTIGSTTLLASSVSLADGAAASLGTLTNAPAAGNPTKWVAINDNGTTRYIPAW